MNTNLLFVIFTAQIAITVAQFGSRRKCGRTITDETEGEISSPGYPDNRYPPNQNCTYIIIAPPNSIIVYSSTFMDLEEPDGQSGRCLYDSLKFFDGGVETNSVCGKQIMFPNGTSTNRLSIEFISDFAKEGTGFHLKWYLLDLDDRPIRYACNFDDPIPLCAGWTNANSSYPWHFTREHTDSANTGPEYDHTTGSATGKYAYIEASGAKRNETAILQSPAILSQRNGAKRCVTFWYHMYGKGMGILRVYLAERLKARTMIAEFSGNYGDVWLEAKETITLRSLMSTITFEALRGMNYTSDIAIDDIDIAEGACNDGGPSPSGTSWFPTIVTSKVPCASILVSESCPEDCDLNCDNFFELAFSSCIRACYGNCACPPLMPIFHQGRCVDYADCPDTGLFDDLFTTQSTPENETTSASTTTTTQQVTTTTTTTREETTSTTTTTFPTTRPESTTIPAELEKKKEVVHDEIIQQILHGILSLLSSGNKSEE